MASRALWLISPVLLYNVPPALAFPNQYNATTDEGDVICAYPLSGQYGVLPRFLYYALLIFAVFAHKQVWLIAGALASALTYSGTAAIHAIALIATTNLNDSAQFDIDIVGVWAILSAACVAYDPVVEWSSTLRESQFRPIFSLWAVLVGIGGCCAFATFFNYYPSEALCIGKDCMQECLSTSQILRAPSEMVVMAEDAAFGTLSILLIPSAVVTLLLGLSFATLGFCCMGCRKRTNAELRNAIKANRAGQGFETPKMARNRRARLKAAKTELKTGQYSKYRSPCSYAGIVAFPVVIVLNEVYLLGFGGLPSNEQPYAIGQWGPWVGALLAVTAALVNSWYEPRWRDRQAILAADRREFELSNTAASAVSPALIQPRPSSNAQRYTPQPAGSFPGNDGATDATATPGSGPSGNDQTAQVSPDPPVIPLTAADRAAVERRLRDYELDFTTSTWQRRRNSVSSFDLGAGPSHA